MRPKVLSFSAVILISVAAIATTAYAGPNDLMGEPAPPSAATRTINVDHDTNYVNLTGGDVVKFVIHGKEFVWNFDTADNINEFELNRILPPGTLHHVVKIYVARDPTYMGA